MHSGNR